jgi:hypothetical protein
MMKNNIKILCISLLTAAGFLVQSCKKDNKASYPPSRIYGAFTYNGQPVGLLATSNDLNSTNNNQNPLVLRQTGPGTYSGGNIKVFAKNDGTYTIHTFDGDYILETAKGKNPFPDPPPVAFTLKGEKRIDFEVTPYFWVSNYQTSFVDSVFKATFRLEKVVPTANLDNIIVYFNTTRLTDISGKIYERRAYPTTQTGLTSTININGDCTINVDLKAFPAAEKKTFLETIKGSTGLLWANVAVKSKEAIDALYQVPVQLGGK